MKKLLKNIVFIVALVVVYFVAKTATASFIDFQTDKEIDGYKYTSAEYAEFLEDLDEKTFFYYNNLPEDLKDEYITVYFSAINFDESFKVTLSEEELEVVVDAVIYDNPEIFWLTGNYTYTTYEDYVGIEHHYSYSRAEADKISSALENKVEEIVSAIPHGASDFEKELFLHDYVCDNTVYDISVNDLLSQTAHSSLLDGRTVCAGYARAMQMLLDEVGINNYILIGNANNGTSTDLHMWNVVEIDGCNYHLDPTWNDGAFTDEQGYFYFNVTDAYIMKTHSDFNFENNNCSYNTANYYQMKNTYVKSFTGFSSLVNATAGILATGENTVEFVFESSSDYKRAVSAIDDDNAFFSYVESSVNQSGRRLQKNSVMYSAVDDYNFLVITFKEV